MFPYFMISIRLVIKQNHAYKWSAWGIPYNWFSFFLYKDWNQYDKNEKQEQSTRTGQNIRGEVGESG